MSSRTIVFHLRSEDWMDSPEMKRLNPLGGYVTIKKHLQFAHKIPKSSLAKFNTLLTNITDQKYYDYLSDEIR